MAMTRTMMRQQAQDILLGGVSVAMSYWTEQHATLAEGMTPEQQDEFRAVLKVQADRIAKMFGFEEIWTS